MKKKHFFDTNKSWGTRFCVGLEEGEKDHTSSSLYSKVYRIRVLKYQHRKIDIKNMKRKGL